MKRTTVNLPAPLIAIVKQLGREHAFTIQEGIEDAIDRWLDRFPGEADIDIYRKRRKGGSR